MNKSTDNPYRHPVPSPVKYPLPIEPASASIPPVAPASASPAHGLDPNAAPAPNAARSWPPADFDMSSTNHVAATFPCAGGNSVSPSNVPASQIAGPAEARYAAVTARFLTGPDATGKK